MTPIVSFTMPGRIPGKIRWVHGKHRQTTAEKRYIEARDAVRARVVKALEGTALPISTPYRVGVAMYLTVGKSGLLPKGGVADYDNLCGTILDALQTCEWCKKMGCECPRPLRVLPDDCPYWYRGHWDVIEAGVVSRDGVYASETDRVVVTIWQAS